MAIAEDLFSQEMVPRGIRGKSQLVTYHRIEISTSEEPYLM